MTFCGCHLRCWWSLLSEYCIRTRIIFYNVTSEYDSAFVFLILRFQLRILKMTEIHQWRKMNFSGLIPCFIDHLLLVSDFRQLPCGNFLLFSLSFSTAAFPSGILNAWGIGMNLCARPKWVIEFVPVAVKWYWWGLCPAPSSIGLVLSSASTTSVFRLSFPSIAVGFPAAIYWCLKRQCCWNRDFQLSTSGFHCELEFFVVWFNEEYSSQLSGIVELWFLDSPSLFCFLFRCIGRKFPHIWPYIMTRGCLFPCTLRFRLNCRLY